MERLIFHIDMDAFFVSVEELFNPELKGKAVVVGGLPGQRGVVCAASYEARKYGVHSAMPLVTAQKLCPHAIFLPGCHARYARFSKDIQQIFLMYTPYVEMVSVDEGYLDFTGCERLYGHPMALAGRLKDDLVAKTGLSASIGISCSRMLSKVASDLAKPRGILSVFPGCEASFLAPLKVAKLPGIGAVTEKRLQDLGIVTVGELARAGHSFLSKSFGFWGECLHRKSLGGDTAHFESGHLSRSISHERTFGEDTTDIDELHATLAHLVEKASYRLRESKLFAATVTLKLRDERFKTITRRATLKKPTQLDSEILSRVLDLIERHWDKRHKIRLIGVALSGLRPSLEQEDLFEEDSRRRRARLYDAADQVRRRFGTASVTSAVVLKNLPRDRP